MAADTCDLTDFESSGNPRTALRDALLDGVSPGLDPDAVDAVEDCGLSGTRAAIRNGHPLPNFDEFPSDSDAAEVTL